jgi:hypothetical protein
MRIRGLLLAVTLVCAACASSAKEADTSTEGWASEIVAYKKAVSETHGIVGYVKVFEYQKPGHGPNFKLYHVYDLDFKERGIVTERGTATKFVYLPAEVARVRGMTLERVELPAQPLEWNTAQILETPTDLTIVEARAEDLK